MPAAINLRSLDSQQLAGFGLEQLAYIKKVQLAEGLTGFGIFMQSEATGDDAYISFDRALERIGKRLRRYKRRLRDHNAGQASEIESIAAQQFVLRGEPEDVVDNHQEPDRLDPVVVAEMQTRLHTLTVGEAVMRLDLTGDAAMMFRNSAHGGLNMVYRRADGNIGWVDPKNLNG